MKSTIAAFTIAGLSIGLSGTTVQASSVTFHFSTSGDPLTGSDVVYQGGDITWTVFASFEGYGDSTAYFGGFVGRFDPSVAGVGSVSNLTSLMAHTAVTPIADGASVTNINIFHSVLLGSNDPSNPLAIFSFDFTPDADAFVGDGATLSYSASGLASVFANSSILLLDDQYTDINIISDRILIPTHGSLGGVLGGLLVGGAGRRRR